MRGVIFDTSHFLTRRQCGDWPWSLIWTHAIADLAIWAAYMVLAGCCLVWAFARRDYPQVRMVTVLFSVFIFACGLTHAMDALTFVWPAYWLEAAIKIVTACVSLTAAGVFVWIMPRMLRKPTAPDIIEAQGPIVDYYEAFFVRLAEASDKYDQATARHLRNVADSCERLRKIREAASGES